MADKRDLLPANATPLERRLAVACADVEDVPVPVRRLRRASTCPQHLLTWLAWERSVDRWNDNWTEAAKRRAIANAFFVHKRKGTIGALRRVVEPLGYLLEVIEWWQMKPEGQRGTFMLSIGVLDTGITEAMYAELERLIDDAKRLSQHMTGLAISLEVRAELNHAIAAYDGDELTVYPYQPERIDVQTVIPYGVREHLIDTMTVYP
ncbi:phage tail protein I [Achromobacter sp. UMC71]|uniref:phage tail protein I n=1 Tax=Achromobacter sp. UMC71 TaxID=1862320 RepID=UPI0016011C3C|nr:phage tail protein I [Achromobacter sp. UMC71]MBB1625183.1 phage tail protein I [Achromobacter sp. UMC71]